MPLMSFNGTNIETLVIESTKHSPTTHYKLARGQKSLLVVSSRILLPVRSTVANPSYKQSSLFSRERESYLPDCVMSLLLSTLYIGSEPLYSRG
jgi:hypothetical protein